MSQSLEKTNTYRNPILPGFNPDPSICYVPGKGYFVSTSTFEYFPGLPIYHSTDLVTWKLIGHAINRRSQGVDMRTVESSSGLWAPTFRYHKGKWYMMCSCFWKAGTSGGVIAPISSGFYVSTDDIFDDSKWSNAVYLEDIGFDQDLFFDDDGKVYQTVTRADFAGPWINGIPRVQSWINEIDLGTGASLTEPLLAKASDLGVAEGCHILKRDGWYYFFTAEGGTHDGHRECVYRSKSPTGPFDPPPEGVNPVLFNHDHPDIQNTGHMDLIEGDDGKWVAVFLGVRPVFEGREIAPGVPGMPTNLGRETFMAPLEWVDGWPVVNRRKPIELVGQAEGLTLVPEPASFVDNFDQKDLRRDWYRIRVPLRDFHSLTEKPGHLAIRGGPHNISVEHCPSVLLQKQTQFDLEWSTEICFEPTRAGEEAGTVVWLNSVAFAAIGVRGDGEGGLRIAFRRPDDSNVIQETVGEANIDAGEPVTLCIQATKQQYNFAYQVKGKTQSLGSVPSAAFTPLFTGVHLGLYAQGANEVPCRHSAYFRYAKWDA